MKKIKVNQGPWKFISAGGNVRVNLTSGKDIKNLSKLDQKMWSVLSMPTSGLEFDQNTLKYLDTDCDGKIRVQEVIAATDWISSVLKDPNYLLKQTDTLPLAEINQDSEDGKRLYMSAQQILKDLKLEQDSISIAQTADSISIFAQTVLNGDGVIIPETADKDDLKEIITSAIATLGGVTDRSGKDGIDADKLEAFYDACAKYDAWKKAGEADKANIFPYGENTAAALDAYNAIKDKVNDYFMRCRLTEFNSDAQSPLDVSAEQFQSITAKNLAESTEDIAAYPLARVSATAELPLDKGINPAWTAAVAAFKSLVIDVDFPKAKVLTAEQWGTFAAKFAPYTAWIGAKDGVAVESLGYDLVKKIVKENKKDKVLALIDEDKSFETEANAISDVDKMLHYVRDIFALLKNYVTFLDFYSPTQDTKSVFQAGTLYIDQRSCNLCINVSDMGKQSAQAGESGIYLIYCECTCKSKPAKMNIVAAMTDGDVSNLYVGKNAIFYDREGNDWDAVVTKIIDNPISIRQAFWSPYRKFAKFIEDQVNKFAAEKDSKVTSDATASISDAGAQATSGEAAKPAQPFDIAKFCGIFAAIGLAIGAIGGILLACVKGFLSLAWWQMPLAILAIMLLISGPAMLMAWLKLRKRNLSPVLNANGWAMNTALIINIPFGNTLTQLAKFPVYAGEDAFKPKHHGRWWKITLTVLIILAIIIIILYSKGLLQEWGVPYHFLKPLKFWA
ncbi:MAG: hypothetical protein MJ007_06780 [Paludibacteraceae bacterium]|nr:hypothetical protein [Paludibacteraceae bacterium]